MVAPRWDGLAATWVVICFQKPLMMVKNFQVETIRNDTAVGNVLGVLVVEPEQAVPEIHNGALQNLNDDVHVVRIREVRNVDAGAERVDSCRLLKVSVTLGQEDLPDAGLPFQLAGVDVPRLRSRVTPGVDHADHAALADVTHLSVSDDVGEDCVNGVDVRTLNGVLHNHLRDCLNDTSTKSELVHVKKSAKF